MLTPEQVAERIPLVDPARSWAAYFVPTDGIAKAVRIVDGAGARRLGAAA